MSASEPNSMCDIVQYCNAGFLPSHGLPGYVFCAVRATEECRAMSIRNIRRHSGGANFLQRAANLILLRQSSLGQKTFFPLCAQASSTISDDPGKIRH